MVESVHQENSGNTVLDEVEYGYDGFGNLSVMTQDPIARDEFVTTNTYTLYTAGGGIRGLYLSRTTMPFGMGTSDDDVMYTADAIGRVMYMDSGASGALADYQYLGAGAVVGNLGPFAENNLYGPGGSADYDTFMDRFNRAKTNYWSGGPGSVAFVGALATHDRVGNMTTLTEKVLLSGASDHNFDHLNTYNDLRQLIAREEGEISGGISPRSRIETFPRNLAGRITRNGVSLDSSNPPDYTDWPVDSVAGGEMDDARTYNKRNELRSRSVIDEAYPSTPKAVTLDYDLNGHLIDDGEKHAYEYDAFGRLVRIWDRHSGSPPTILLAEYTYNGLGQRISERLDTDGIGADGKADGLVDGYDKVFHLALNTAGQRIATYRATDAEPKEVFFRHAPGVRGPLTPSGGLVMRERNVKYRNDPTTWATVAGGWQGPRDQFCTDFSGNIVALVGADGLVEQYRYSPSGVPYGLPLGDVDGDSVVAGGGGGGDHLIVDGLITLSAYEERADFDLDGDVDSADLAIVVANNGHQLSRGRFSVGAVRNIHGWGQGEVFGEGLHIIWWNGLTSRATGLGILLEHRKASPDPNTQCAPGFHYDAVLDQCVMDFPSPPPTPVPTQPPAPLTPPGYIVGTGPQCAEYLNTCYNNSPLIRELITRLQQTCTKNCQSGWKVACMSDGVRPIGCERGDRGATCYGRCTLNICVTGRSCDILANELVNAIDACKHTAHLRWEGGPDGCGEYRSGRTADRAFTCAEIRSLWYSCCERENSNVADVQQCFDERSENYRRIHSRWDALLTECKPDGCGWIESPR